MVVEDTGSLAVARKTLTPGRDFGHRPRQPARIRAFVAPWPDSWRANPAGSDERPHRSRRAHRSNVRRGSDDVVDVLGSARAGVADSVEHHAEAIDRGDQVVAEHQIAEVGDQSGVKPERGATIARTNRVGPEHHLAAVPAVELQGDVRLGDENIGDRGALPARQPARSVSAAMPRGRMWRQPDELPWFAGIRARRAGPVCALTRRWDSSASARVESTL